MAKNYSYGKVHFSGHIERPEQIYCVKFQVIPSDHTENISNSILELMSTLDRKCNRWSGVLSLSLLNLFSKSL